MRLSCLLRTQRCQIQGWSSPCPVPPATQFLQRRLFHQQNLPPSQLLSSLPLHSFLSPPFPSLSLSPPTSTHPNFCSAQDTNKIARRQETKAREFLRMSSADIYHNIRLKNNAISQRGIKHLEVTDAMWDTYQAKSKNGPSAQTSAVSELLRACLSSFQGVHVVGVFYVQATSIFILLLIVG